jgi:hypothetical protein
LLQVLHRLKRSEASLMALRLRALSRIPKCVPFCWQRSQRLQAPEQAEESL